MFRRRGRRGLPGQPGARTVAAAVGERGEAEGYAGSGRVTAGRILGVFEARRVDAIVL